MNTSANISKENPSPLEINSLVSVDVTLSFQCDTEQQPEETEYQ